MIFVVCAAYESRTFRTRTRCCTTRGRRRSIFRDVNSESVCINGVDTLVHVIKVLSARGFGIWIGHSLCHGPCRLRCMLVCIPVKNFLYQNKELYYQRRASFVFSGCHF